MSIAPGTTAFYDDWAAHGQEAPRSAVSRHFETAFAPGARVLDVGCGKGRDVVALLDMGFDGYGVEPHAAMRAAALARDARVAARIADATLPALGQPFGGGFDGVVCSAVLMHVAPGDLGPALAALATLLRPAGRLLIALPEMRADLLVDGRDPDGRQFANHAPAHVESLLGALGFAMLSCEELSNASSDTHWRVLLLEHQARGAASAESAAGPCPASAQGTMTGRGPGAVPRERLLRGVASQ
ncbi:MAG TPA: methyltransferase domain-containing protein [Burkholderiaceae bacterium]